MVAMVLMVLMVLMVFMMAGSSFNDGYKWIW